MKGIKYHLHSPNKRIEIKRCKSSLHSSKPHFHDEISIGLIESGQCETKLGGRPYFLQGNTLLLIPSDMIHQCHPADSEQWSFRMAYINRDWFESISGISSGMLPFIYKRLDGHTYDKIQSSFQTLESTHHTTSDEIHLLHNVMSTLSLLSNNKTSIEEGSSQSKKIQEIHTYLRKSYLDPIALEDLEQVSGLSKSYIIRQFKDTYGVSPHQYLTTLRINFAKKMIRNNYSIADTAISSGFYDQSHFTKYFKQYIGLTPVRYKNDIHR